MGGVKIEPYNVQIGAGGGDRFAYFADDFLRADQPTLIGTFWNANYITGLTANDPGQVGNVVNTSVAGLSFNNGAFGVSIPNVLFSPWAINPYSGRDQFAEMRILTGTANVNTANLGVCCFWTPNSGTFYELQAYNNGASFRWRLNRAVAGVFTTLIALTAATYGDTIRLEVTSLAGTNTLTVYVNGTQVGQTTDAILASQGQAGIRGNVAIGNAMTASLFKCGTLPQALTSNNYTQSV